MFENIFNSWSLLLTSISICLLILIIGNPLLLGIIHFEKNGGDPKKRSLANQMTSDLASVALLGINPNIGSHILRIVFGCLDQNLIFPIIFFRRVTFMLGSLFMVEIVTFKMLRMFQFFSNINDNFWSVFLLFYNAMMSIITISILTMYDGLQSPLTDFLLCHTPVQRNLNR